MYFDKIKWLFSNPEKFYKEASKEKSYFDVLKFFSVIYISAIIIQLLVTIIFNSGLIGQQILIYAVTALIVGIIYAFVGPFIASLITHLGILILVKGRSFFSTFKAITYGMIIVVAYGLLSSIIGNIIFFSNPDSISVNAFIVGFISLIGVVHMLIAQTIGVSRFHSITKGKAFLGIVLIPIIILIVFIAMGGFGLY